MRSILALLRASWLTGLSYRLATVLSFVGLAVSVVPIYFVANAMQQMAAESIRAEGGNYFGFILVGIAATYVLSAAVSAIPSALSGSIGNGTLEAMLVTRTPLPALLVGLSSYGVLQSLLRALVLLVGASMIGVEIAWRMLPAVAAIGVLMILCYGAIGLVAGALVLRFRTSGPLITAVIAGSGLLGGVYYSTTVIPGWLRALSDLVPVTYALRAGRMLLLGGASLTDVTADTGMLALLAVTGLAIGMLAFAAALSHARRHGTLSQY